MTHTYVQIFRTKYDTTVAKRSYRKIRVLLIEAEIWNETRGKHF
jgi:hypothetical protein